MEMCRACLTTGTAMIPMDENFLNEYNLLTSLNITMEDMPLFTCRKCYDGAKFCVEFREKCIESDQTLKNILCPYTKQEKAESDYEKDTKEEKAESDDEKLISVKNELKTDMSDDDIEFIEECYIYGIDYVLPSKPTEAVTDSIDSEEYTENITKPSEQQEKQTMDKCFTSKNNVKPIKEPKKRTCKSKIVKTDVVDTKFLCGICPNVCNDIDELINHLDDHKKDYACSICKDSLISVPHMLGHRIKHVPEQQKKCHMCKKKMKSSESLEFHYMRVHEMAEKDAEIQCKKCLKPFLSVRKLLKHAGHHAEYKYTCDHCSKSFRRLNALRVHMNKHSTKRTFKCNLCDHTSKYANGIYTHKMKKHTTESVVCKTCGRVFASQEKLDKHDCRHRLPVVCPICGITFQAKGKSTFTEHLHSHDEKPRFRCTQCPATYRSRAAMRAHTDQHDGTPRFICNVCKRAFYACSALIRHRKTHTGEKPFVCNICSRGFAGSYNLKIHMKVHGIVNLIKKKEDT